MQVAVLTFEGFNELDSFIAAAMINRVEAVVHYVAPVGEKQAYVERAAAAVRRCLPAERELV